MIEKTDKNNISWNQKEQEPQNDIIICCVHDVRSKYAQCRKQN